MPLSPHNSIKYYDTADRCRTEIALHKKKIKMDTFASFGMGRGLLAWPISCQPIENCSTWLCLLSF